MNHPRRGAGRSVGIYNLRNGECRSSIPYLSYLLELVLVHVGEDVEFRLGEDLEGHGAVVVLQWGDVIVAHGQLRPRVDLVAEGRESREGKTVKGKNSCRHPPVWNSLIFFMLFYKGATPSPGAFCVPGSHRCTSVKNVG